jgi:hypothetical protein
MLTAEAFWVVQDNVDDPPGDTVTGCALNVNVVGWLTVTVTDGENAVPLLPVPTGPLADTWYVVLLFRGGVV